MKTEVVDQKLRIEIDLDTIALKSASGLLVLPLNPEEPAILPDQFHVGLLVAIAGEPE